MALVCVGSVHGAPGGTTLALLLAGLWPRRALLVELDPAGGVLAVRYGLGRSPGLADLAAGAASHSAENAVWQCAQELPGGLPVVVAPESGEVVTAILRDASRDLGTWCAELGDLDVVADCGRLTPDSAADAVVDAADAVCVVARNKADELVPSALRVRGLSKRGGRRMPVGLVLVGDRPYSEADVSAELGVRVWGVIEHDKRSADLLREGGSARALRRSLLVRSANSLVDALAERLDIVPTPDSAVASPPAALEAGGGSR